MATHRGTRGYNYGLRLHACGSRMGIPLGKFVLHNPDAVKLHVLGMMAHGKE